MHIHGKFRLDGSQCYLVFFAQWKIYASFDDNVGKEVENRVKDVVMQSMEQRMTTRVEETRDKGLLLE